MLKKLHHRANHHHRTFDPAISGVLKSIFNAAQAICDKAGVISITTEADEQNAYITIADNGSGIDNVKLNKIFDPFLPQNQ